MSSDPHNEENGRLSAPDQIVSDMYDRDGNLGDSSDTFCDFQKAETLNANGRRHVARMQFLHALLLRVHRPEPKAMESRIARVLDSVSEIPQDENSATEDSSPTISYATRRHWMARVVMAATLLLTVGVVWNWSGAVLTAEAAVDQALKAFQLPVNREYEVSSLIRNRRGGERNLRATLTVKEGMYAYRQPTAREDSPLWIGSDGENSWLVPAWGPVIVSNGVVWSPKWLTDQDSASPFLELPTMLMRLRDNYRLEFLAPTNLVETLASSNIVSFRHIRGTLIGETDGLPRSIDVWGHPETGEVRRMVLDWETPPTETGLMRVTFDLKGRPEISDDWYQHKTHHDPKRKVILRQPVTPHDET